VARFSASRPRRTPSASVTIRNRSRRLFLQPRHRRVWRVAEQVEYRHHASTPHHLSTEVAPSAHEGTGTGREGSKYAIETSWRSVTVHGGIWIHSQFPPWCMRPGAAPYGALSTPGADDPGRHLIFDYPGHRALDDALQSRRRRIRRWSARWRRQDDPAAAACSARPSGCRASLLEELDVHEAPREAPKRMASRRTSSAI